MDAKTRREQRQAKIRAAGTDRLAKITKTTRPEAEDYKQPVSQQDEQEKQEQPSNKTTDEDPPESVPQYSTSNEKSEQMEAFGPQQQQFGQGNDDANDPFVQMMQQLQNSGQMPEGMPSDPFSDPMTAFNAMMNGEGAAGAGQEQQPAQKQINASELFWQIVHVIAIISLTLYVHMFNLTHTTMFKLCTLELVLLTTRFMVERGSPPANSMLSMIAQYLPPPFNGYVNMAARYMRFATIVAQDMSLCLLVTGLCSLF